MTRSNTIRTTCLMQSSRALARRVSALYEHALRAVDLSASQFSMLVALDAAGPASVARLGSELAMDRTTATRVLRPLSARGLVEIAADKDDRRRRVVRLTDAGSGLLDEARPLWARAQARARERMGADAARTLRALDDALA